MSIHRALSRSFLTTVLLSSAFPAAAGAGDPAPNAADSTTTELPEVVVTSTLQPTTVLTVPTSVTVLDSSVLEGASQQHFQDVLSQVPNLNWAGDTSRPRYFQIRGIGELEQYQGAPNPSVGFLIDDIDFSGLGSAATLYDVDQVEVLRGPQGTRYGANALAGLIYVKSKEPENQFDAGADAGASTYNSRSYGAYLTGPLGDGSSARLAVQRYTSDGFYHNLYLNRYDTNRRDEQTLRGRWRYQPSAALRVDVTVLRAQIDNGYDGYAIDNTRNTQSDNPSVDTQHSTGVAVKARYALAADTALTAIATYAGSRIAYGYDGDWGNPQLWAQPQYGDVIYNYTELQHRYRNTRSAELRIGRDGEQAFHWVAGVYALQLHETLDDTSLGIYQTNPADPTTASITDTVIDSGYRSINGAVYGEVGNDLGERWHWTAGARLERRTTSYNDLTTSPGAPDVANHFAPADNLWGGALTLNYRLQPNETVYGALQRGYKAGGFNLSPGLLPGQQIFAPESDVNAELGYKAALLDRRLHVTADVFYTRRSSLQAKTSEQTDPANPDSFVFYTENVPHGYNEGVEVEARWRASERWTLGGALGLLETQYSGLVQNGMALPNRRLAHAAPWQAAFNAAYRDPRGWFGRIDVTGVGPFYFDLPPNPTTSGSYWLTNLKAGYEFGDWSVSLWAHNLFNREYAVRGFFFGDEPPDFPNKLYTQLGDPRVVGLDVSWRLGSTR
jgi:outer membrane receptor protein involved in Fe transport